MKKLTWRIKLKNIWQSMAIKNKIKSFTGMVFLLILIAVVFDVWTVRFLLTDFSQILEDNKRSSAFVDAMEKETELFESYIKNPDDEKLLVLTEACAVTQSVIDNLTFEYSPTNELRYSKTWAIRNSYEVYAGRRQEILLRYVEANEYIDKLYEIYAIQRYLQDYARTLMRYTMEAGNVSYQHKVPGLQVVLVIVITLGVVLLTAVVKLTDVMNKTIVSPVMKLVKMSGRVANNDFFVPDVEVESRDELGQLVKAYNKMKYATGQYILALEEKRKTMDLLHQEELERVELERRLEVTQLEMLKNQINPHFIFNTLNVIAGMAKLEDAETTEKMIKALSTLFRYNLKTAKMEIPLHKELHVISEYMYLQKMRFGDRIAFEIICRANADEVRVPSFTLQPLVENAIIHGLSKKEEGGKLSIRIWLREKILYIVVADTGVGIAKTKLIELRKQIEQEKEIDIGIGLANVYKRIKGLYQEGAAQIYSRQGQGTFIRLKIPQI